jgi:hypothetical protein
MGRSIRSIRQILSPAILLAAFLLLTAHSVPADELKLKDGTTISGTIVGFEENSFKVKTSYGYAVVQKDQVLSIIVAEAAKAEPEKKPEPVAVKAPAPEKPKTETAVVAVPVAAPPAPAPAPRTAPAAPVAMATPTPVPPVTVKAAAAAPGPPAPSSAARTPPAAPGAVAAPTPAAPTPVMVAAPPKPPEPEPIHEAVVGNMYTNETYRFHMYKPPDWDVIAAAPAVLPGAITAMGTADDTTYLLIGQEPAGKSLATDMDATEHRLRDAMENFRPLDEKQIMVGGAAATERHFRGSVDEHDWSGVVVFVQRGGRFYTIFGMTRADNDLVQIQENVIARAISSLQFTD